MEENYIIIAIIAVIAIVLVSLFIVVANLQKTVLIRVKEKSEYKEEEKKTITIEQLVELAAKRTTSRNDLTAAILRASKECHFPKKEKGVAPKSAKIYLNFVLLVASHKNADAKLIAFMNVTLKEANPEYKTEIDIYENEGIHQRGNRV